MPNKPELIHGHYCYAIIEDCKDDNGYIPALVVEGETGYYPMLGNGVGASPWYWGTVLANAEAIAKKANEKLGLTEERVAEIIASSMRQSGWRVGR